MNDDLPPRATDHGPRTLTELLRDESIRRGLPGEPVLVAVSGGADSVALLRGLVNLREELRLRLVAAHFNHRWRGVESDADAAWVAAFCDSFGVDLVLGQRAETQSVPTTAREETARRQRYRFLEEAAITQGCTRIAVAHTADDQTETVLHHILRGTGLSGLRGMQPVRELPSGVRLVRPLLHTTRAEIVVFLAELGQDYRTDRSNDDVSLTRNRIRHALLPLLRSDYNPQVDEALRRLAQQAAEAEAALATAAELLLSQGLLESTPAVCRLNLIPLRSQPRHLIRQCLVHLWIRQHWPRQAMGFPEWDRLAELVQHGGTAMLPERIEASVRGELLVLRRQ